MGERRRSLILFVVGLGLVFLSWDEGKAQREGQRPLRRVAPERKEGQIPISFRVVTKRRRPQRLLTQEEVERLALSTLAVPLAFRQPLEQAEMRLAQALTNLAAWQETRHRIEVLQKALLPLASKAQLSPWRFARLLLRGQPPATLSELNAVFAPLGGEPIPQRLIRMGLTRRRETLAEILNWFPDIRDTLLQRLRTLGAQLVGGAAPTGTGLGQGIGAPPGPSGPAGAPPIMGMRGGMAGPMGAPPIAGVSPGGLGGPEFEAGLMGMGGMPMGGMPMMGPPGPAGAPGPPGGGGITGVTAAPTTGANFYRYLWMARMGLIEPEYAAVFFFALEAYKEQVEEQIRLAAAEAKRTREEWAELKEVIVTELKKLSRTTLRRRRR